LVAAWTVFIWVFRSWNLIRDDDRSFGFIAVHLVIAAISVALAVGVWRVASRWGSKAE
jgi:hypothetical protein